MLKTGLILALILALLLIVSIGYTACAAAGHEDDVMERAYVKWEKEHSAKENAAPAETEV